jgi:hypothetical protein
MLNALTALLALLARPVGPPAMVGLATYYDFADGSIMRDGSPLASDGLTCAVDASEWAALAGRELIVGVEGRYVRLRVADTGRLYDVGKFAYSGRSGTWVPADVGPRVILDVPAGTYRRLFAKDGDTRLVSVWVKGE